MVSLSGFHMYSLLTSSSFKEKVGMRWDSVCTQAAHGRKHRPKLNTHTGCSPTPRAFNQPFPNSFPLPKPCLVLRDTLCSCEAYGMRPTHMENTQQANQSPRHSLSMFTKDATQRAASTELLKQRWGKRHNAHPAAVHCVLAVQELHDLAAGVPHGPIIPHHAVLHGLDQTTLDVAPLHA